MGFLQKLNSRGKSLTQHKHGPSKSQEGNSPVEETNLDYEILRQVS